MTRFTHNRASLRQNLSSGVCEQHRRRPACASAQTDQRHCYSLTGKYHILTCFKRNFNILASLCSCEDWFEFRLVGYPENRFCRDEAQLAIVFLWHYSYLAYNAPNKINMFVKYCIINFLTLGSRGLGIFVTKSFLSKIKILTGIQRRKYCV